MTTARRPSPSKRRHIRSIGQPPVTGYIDRELVPITHARWLELSGNSEYADICKYIGEDFQVHAQWIGIIENPHVTFQGQWAPFSLTVLNRVGDDSDKTVWSIDPALTESYTTEANLREAYQRWVEQYSASYRDKAGTLIEVGNKAWVGNVGGDDTPAETVESFGSW